MSEYLDDSRIILADIDDCLNAANNAQINTRIYGLLQRCKREIAYLAKSNELRMKEIKLLTKELDTTPKSEAGNEV